MESSSIIARWVYVAACVVVPVAWGAITAWLFSRRGKKAADAAAQAAADRPPMDYVI